MNESNKGKCYWCGNPKASDEHVPPQNLFPKGFRIELITVPACKTHNEDFSKIDERIRVHLTEISAKSEIARNHFSNKIVRGLKRKESRGLAIDLLTNKFTDTEGKNHSREKAENFDLYFEKIIRGIFYYHFKKIIGGSTHFFSNKMQMIHLSANAHFYYYTVEKEYSNYWIEGNPKNKEVFDYKYYFSETENRFFIIMKFYEYHTVIGTSLPKGKKIDDYSLSFEEYKNKSS
jgi:hypothetical protein